MSGKVEVTFEVTNMDVMQQTLEKLGHKFTKNGEVLTIARSYYNIEIAKNKISCDSMNTGEVERIKVEYQRDYQLYERAVRGEIYEMTETNNEIVIMVQ